MNVPMNLLPFRVVSAVGLAMILAACSGAATPSDDTPTTDGGTKDGGKKDGGKKDSGGGKDASVGDDDDDDDDDDASVGDDDDDDDDDDDASVGDDDDDDDGGPVTGLCTNPGHESPGQYPQTDFDPQPSYIPNDTLVLTLDDGPDTTNTKKILDTLKQRNIKATWFINTNNWGGPESLIKRMIDEGHEIANHTASHPHLQTLSATDIEKQITDVEKVVSTQSGGSIPKLTLLRAPYGEPYQDGPVGTPAARNLVFPVVAKHAVAINWNFDTFDTVDTPDANKIFQNFKDAVKTPGASGASWGIFLMHSVHPADADALPLILDYIKQNHFKLARVEDVLCWKFGKHSKDLVP